MWDRFVCLSTLSALPSPLQVETLRQEHASLEAKHTTGIQFVHQRALQNVSACVLLGALQHTRIQSARRSLTQRRVAHRRVKYNKQNCRFDHHVLLSMVAMDGFYANGVTPSSGHPRTVVVPVNGEPCGILGFTMDHITVDVKGHARNVGAMSIQLDGCLDA
jgi:hypothetical protein